MLIYIIKKNKMFVASFKTQIICYPAFLHYYYKVP